ncbi:Muramidase-2 precursor [Lentilactobacillus parabuchneri]|jgi:hypothetical protein|uniref:Muramidase n=2 Tax=Lentilactobacillus parabuchneri TaxID=152331 RepID=A0A1X1FCC2_9LACO|nr:glucosaminidase domain-containing protein [Lentilactobacillus parabuchneri]APR08225.1 Muramidase-2 precursor [Lentilactobacillus parabuchneri]KRM44441.1 lysozyme [Lentilactobacillus parabuchneri DSM 5707 = NBRC 107865]KRN74653.1 lysozyme [Lentilactobacillus parabuchneri]MBW0222483.1 glucosaminidase domain-containing protein [Lentilactobacillus parabuchneri]MBW0244668.1 glucosaminidase domain-containing protein [Lentilactobacillus parabuchneri]
MMKALAAAIAVIGFCFVQANIANASVETDFINRLKDPVVKVSKQNHLYPSVMMAQAIVESDFGRSELSLDANNYFGVKGSYNGQSVTMSTGEYTANGKHYMTAAAFKKYPTIEASIKDNAYLLRHGTLTDSNYYSGTWTSNAPTSSDAAMALSLTYATDMEYGNKLNAIIVKYDLNKLDGSVSSGDINSKIDASLDKQLAGNKKQEAEVRAENAQSKINSIPKRIIPNFVFNTKGATKINQGDPVIQFNSLPLQNIVEK